jgi:phage gp36-like protein
MAYATLTDLAQHYPLRTRIDLSDETGEAVLEGVWEQALTSASAEIDAWLAAIPGLVLPLTAPPPALAQACCDIAVYRRMVMFPQTASEDQKDRYESWLKLFRAWIASKTLPPGAAGGETVNAEPAANASGEPRASVMTNWGF